MPTVNAEIAITATGGDAAAAELQKTAGSLDQLGESAGKSTEGLKGMGRLEHAGLHMFSSEVLSMIPGMEHVHGLSRVMAGGLGMLKGAFLGVPILGWIVGIGVAVGAVAGLIAHHKKLYEELVKSQKEHRDLIQTFDDSTKAGTRLTAAQKFYYDQLKQVETQERSVVLEHMRSAIAKDREAVSTLTLWQATKMLLGTLPGLHALQDQVLKQLESLNLVLAKDTAAYVEMKKSGKSVTDGLRDQTNEAKKNTKEAGELGKKWLEALHGMEGALTNFQVSMMDTFTVGGTTAKEAFKTLGDSVVHEFERMIAKAITLKIITASLGAFGITLPKNTTQGLPGFQFGGTVPGPEGSPRLAVVHGGERITNPSGMGGGPGGGMVFAPNFVGGMGGLSPHDQRLIVRQLRRQIRSTGELGLT